jgi:hypothetical protein
VEHYESAAIRHLNDAKQLKKLGSFDNAGHLIGFAAECAIKHHLASIQPSKKSPHGHFPDFLVTARKHITCRSSMFQVIKQDIFNDWDVSQRYFATGTTSQTDVNRWISQAQRVFAAANLKVRQ